MRPTKKPNAGLHSFVSAFILGMSFSLNITDKASL